MRQPDPDIRRYRRLNQLVNGMISQPWIATYFILPELALPAHWFMRIALKLWARGISLITGIEYFHVSKAPCATLRLGLHYPTMDWGFLRP